MSILGSFLLFFDSAFWADLGGRCCVADVDRWLRVISLRAVALVVFRCGPQYR